MNQEYIRQTVKRLLWLSDYIASEFDMSSDNSNDTHIRFQERKIKDIYDLAALARKQDDIGILLNETYVDPWLYKQLNMTELIKSDPFLPKEIRKKFVDMYSDRVYKMTTAYCNVIEKYCKDLYHGKIKDEFEEVEFKLIVKIGHEYRKVKWGWDETEKKVNKLRSAIEKYLMKLK